MIDERKENVEREKEEGSIDGGWKEMRTSEITGFGSGMSFFLSTLPFETPFMSDSIRVGFRYIVVVKLLGRV